MAYAVIFAMKFVTPSPVALAVLVLALVAVVIVREIANRTGVTRSMSTAIGVVGLALTIATIVGVTDLAMDMAKNERGIV